MHKTTRLHRKRCILYCWMVLAWMLCFTACERRPVPNVLLITVDTLRADRLGCYGFGLARTPHIDGLAAEGVRSTNAITAAPITMPSHATILTGLYPSAHGVRDNGAYALGDGAVTLTERLKAAGYTTQAFVSALVLNRRYNLTQGFDGYDDDLWAEDAPPMFMIRKRPAAKTAGRFLAWFEQWRTTPKRKPFFAWVHFFDPHQPYKPPPQDRLFAPTLYDAEIAAVDRAVGQILSALRQHQLLDNTLVILTADHGESLGEHQEKTHALFIYDATVHVPLIFRYPRVVPHGKVYTGPVRTVDIVPTVLGIVGLPGGKETQGVDLLPAWRGTMPPPDLPQYSESLLSEVGFGMAPLYGVRKGGYTWIRAPKPELYDLGHDPHELHNLYADGDERAAKLDRELEAILEGSRRFAITAGNNPMTQETAEMLRSLGYVAGGQERKSMQGIDPKDGLPIYNKLEEARHFAQRSQWAAAGQLLHEILDTLPGHVAARNILAFVLLRQHRWEDAKDQYLHSLATDPQQSRVYAMLGTLALIQQNLDEAEQHYQQALELTPAFVEAMVDLGAIELARGNTEKAEAWYKKTIAADPGFPRAYAGYADFYYQQRNYEAALTYYRKTLDMLPHNFHALINAGHAAHLLSDVATARTFYQRAERLRPDSWLPPYNFACLAAIEGDPQQAIVLLEQAVSKGFANVGLLQHDEDLHSLRPLPAFQKLFNAVQEQAAGLPD